MKKLLVLCIALMLTVCCSCAGAESLLDLVPELYVPASVEEMRVTPVIMPKPAEYTLTYEDGYYVIKTDWFDNYESANTKSILIQIGSKMSRFTYNADRDAYISNNALAEGTLTNLTFQARCDTAVGYEEACWMLWYREDPATGTYSYVEEMLAASLDHEYMDDIRYDAQGNMLTWNRGYYVDRKRVVNIEVYFDSNGNTEAYIYHDARDGIDGYAEYLPDGTLLTCSYSDSEVDFFYAYDPEWGTDGWENFVDGSYEPPEGYDLARLYEIYPPLLGSAPDFSIPGDADDDGDVLLDDAMAMLKHLAGQQIEISDPAADVNGDKIVDMKDILLILQYFAGWNVELK